MNILEMLGLTTLADCLVAMFFLAVFAIFATRDLITAARKRNLGHKLTAYRDFATFLACAGAGSYVGLNLAIQLTLFGITAAIGPNSIVFTVLFTVSGAVFSLWPLNIWWRGDLRRDDRARARQRARKREEELVSA